MTVLSGRASSGAPSVLRALFFGVFAVLGLVAGGCGNSTVTNGTPVVTISTTPGPFIAYIVEIDQIAMTRTDNTVVYPLSPAVPEIVDFTKFNDMTELFGAPAIVEGSYVSASITVNYSGAKIYTLDASGAPKAVTLVDPNSTTGAAPTSVTYTVKFDPANPLVIKHGVSTPIDFNFDLSASSVLNRAVTPATLTVRPMMTASTVPAQTKPIRARGVFVTTSASSFTMNTRAFFDVRTNPVGAVEIQTDANTTYNVNGVAYTGASGLAALSKLPINSIIEAYGSLGTLTALKPNFVATEVYAGISVENLAADRVTGTVTSRSGNTLNIHGAEVETRDFSGTVTIGTVVSYIPDLPVTVDSTTIVSVDRHPELQNLSIQNISIGQQVDLEGVALDSTGAQTTVNVASVRAIGGLVRLIPTAAWGVLKTAQAGSATASLISLGGYGPQSFTYTGTGSPTGADADPNSYAINTGTIDLTAQAATTPLVRFDGRVTPFGAAPPDFAADAATLGSATEQVLTVEWVNGGTASPFVTADSTGLVVNMSDANLGTSHTVQMGPLYIASTASTTDLTNPKVNPKIVVDTTVNGAFAIGNPSSTTGLSSFNSYASYLTQVTTVLNGTNKIQKLVAVGKYDKTTGTFTAHRIDMIQLP
jgi:hypothetical protein